VFKKRTTPELPYEEAAHSMQPAEDTRTPEEIAEERIAEWKADPFGRNLMFKDDWRSFGQQTIMLHLEHLKLKTIPESLRNLREVEVINLWNNKIQELPEWIGELKALKAINLGSNLLRQLPQQIGELPELSVISLQNNRLESLPESLRHLPITELPIEDNPGLGLPESILDRPPQEILRYYFESRAEEGRPLLELKLLLVGRGKAGKTTLVKQLAGEEANANESETHSIAIRELMLGCPEGRVRTRAWDFGGQEILHSTHQFFLTERSLYLLVLEPRTGLAQRDAEYWLKLIETQGNGSPVIVVLNWSGGSFLSSSISSRRTLCWVRASRSCGGRFRRPCSNGCGTCGCPFRSTGAR
jgi:DAPkinase-like Roc (Ras of Complex) protein/Leucine Rich Repeat (LRR) protein